MTRSMKHITKQPQPQKLIAWTREKSTNEEGEALTWTYDDMPADVRQAVKESLINEQGALCCYTGRRISPATSHIEHLKPQALCTAHEDTDYSNMLAAYPSSDPGTPHCQYGAHAKADWYDQLDFVHPLRHDCEDRFCYRDTGKIVPTYPTDRGAAITIKKLSLDSPQLERMRKAAIDAAFEERLTKAQTQRLIEAMDTRDGNGRFRPFCFVIKQAYAKYLKRFDPVPKRR